MSETARAAFLAVVEAGIWAAGHRAALGALEARIETVRQIRQPLREDAGTDGGHALGLEVHLALSPDDRPAALQRLLEARPARGTESSEPRDIAGQLASFAEHTSEGFGGWRALGHPLDETDAAVQGLRAPREERLKPHILQQFGLGDNGSTSIISGLDGSVLYQTCAVDFRQRYDGVRAFMGEAAGVAVDDSDWRHVFDMTVFCDTTLAKFCNRLPGSTCAHVLRQQVSERVADLVEIITRPGEPLRGLDLLTEYARDHPFPCNVLLARPGPGDTARSAADTEAPLLDMLDEAIADCEPALTGADKQEILDHGRRVPDVALAVSLTNDEAHVLAGATHTALSGTKAARLFRGLDVSLDRIRRLHLKDLRDTVAENWLVHVRPHLGNAMRADPAGFAALDLVTQQTLPARAFYAPGKYGQFGPWAFRPDMVRARVSRRTWSTSRGPRSRWARR